jgi:hypothetical protein
MVIRVLRGQPELKIALVEPGGRTPASVDDVRLILTAPPPPVGERVSRIVRKGDWGWPPGAPDDYPPEPDRMPSIVYPAFGLDDEGAVVFRLDSLLWERPCGRYVGRVEVGHRLSATIDVDLHPIRWTLDSVETRP